MSANLRNAIHKYAREHGVRAAALCMQTLGYTLDQALAVLVRVPNGRQHG